MIQGGAWLAQWLLVLGAVVGPGDEDGRCADLGRLDLQRAAAMSRADVVALRAVYADPTLANDDIDVVRSYAERDLRLHVGAMVRLRCGLLDEQPGRARLEVVERLGPSSVTTTAGVRRDLPVDRPDRRVIELRRVDGTWRIAGVSISR